MNKSPRGIVTPADRAKTIVYRGKKIFKIDFANCQIADVRLVMEAARKVVHVQPPKSILVFVDLTNTEVTAEVIQEMNLFASDNAPYVKASAVVGITGSRQLILDAVNKSTQRNIQSFPNPLAAQNWLVSQ
jgi:hypothetical protein